MNCLTILICTHNRAELLTRVLASLQSAEHPQDWRVEILVVANACTDATHDLLERERQAGLNNSKRFPVHWLAEPQPGKSHALNVAIPLVQQSDIVTFVDDDHRVDPHYLTEICRAAQAYPDATLFCGRILPDWDGSEPAWVHDEGPYRIYPLPVPRQDLGPSPRTVEIETGPLPGGGNLFLRPTVFSRVGGFSTQLGPKGHDLAGGEDSAFITNALECGECLQYVPAILQYHYVDHERLRLLYLLRKAYQRSRSVSRVKFDGYYRIPLYMWRKLAEYGLLATLPLGWTRTRFFLMRLASTLGEMRGLSEAARTAATPPCPRRPRPRTAWPAAVVTLIAAGLAAMHSAVPAPLFWTGLNTILVVTILLALLMGIKSLLDFSQTGPKIRQEILAHYRWYSLLAFGRLLAFASVIFLVQAAAGVLVYGTAAYLWSLPYQPPWIALAALGGVVLLTGLQFCHHLLLLPASLVASSLYRVSRFYPLWRWLSLRRLRWVTALFLLAAGGLVGLAGLALTTEGNTAGMLGAFAFTATAGALYRWLRTEAYPKPVAVKNPSDRPNVLMIGCDTLRADRIGSSLTPNLSALGHRGVHFTQCYVPCARTAPSLISLLTGTWPQRHGIRDNYAADADRQLPVEALPGILSREGYTTAALSDWCGADMGKFSLGFDYVDLPEDQWNLKFFLRQGPKDLRLFLSLFTHNAFGKDFLPEIHYLGGIPLTDELGRESCRLINRLAATECPFFLNVFFSTTHPPFGSEYPYYTLYSPDAYTGESKFAMARLADPQEIIRRQAETREAFDLDQIIHLYDGCVRRFDDEAARILRHLDACGLADNTIVVIYSDHGMEFFERDTWGQGNSVVCDHSARIPLLMVDPRIANGRQVDEVVRSIDVAPTLLDLLGLPPAPAMDGTSLAPYLRDPQARLALDAYNETGIWLTEVPGMHPDHLRYPNLLELLEVPDKHTGTLAINPEYQERIIVAKDRMIRRGRWKLVYQPLESGPCLLLFDMESDPECTRDVGNIYPEICDELWQVLQGFMNRSAGYPPAVFAP